MNIHIFQTDITIKEKSAKLVDYVKDLKIIGIGDIQAVANVIDSINRNAKGNVLEENVTQDIVQALSFFVDSDLKTNLMDKAGNMNNKYDNFLIHWLLF